MDSWLLTLASYFVLDRFPASDYLVITLSFSTREELLSNVHKLDKIRGDLAHSNHAGKYDVFMTCK